MLTTGIRTPIGIKVFGSDLAQIAAIGESLESILRDVPGTRSVYAERELGGFFVDFVPDRDAIARYGLRSMDVMEVIETAIGGLDVDTTIEGRERYRINVRYPRELRTTSISSGALSRPWMARRSRSRSSALRGDDGPPMIKSEGGSLVGWVCVDVEGRGIGYVRDEGGRRDSSSPAGIAWPGQTSTVPRVIRQRFQSSCRSRSRSPAISR
jgi:Cu(I)/Ag(I) efflux system membrane protein CusA/SilA